MKKFWGAQTPQVYRWDSVGNDDEGREEIHKWSKRRQQKLHWMKKAYHGFLLHSFSLDTLWSFVDNFNFMVIIQMMLAGLSIYLFQRYDIFFDMNVALYVSPIVFPLAFSINTDFQRRERVLEDLACFKTNCMFWFFCAREWKEAAGLDDKWMNSNHTKLKSILFHLREYLLTGRIDRRKVILNAMYEDLSDSSQLIEQVRAKQLPLSTAIGGNLVTFLQAMTLSFERLRNVREYRSPRSIRAFNKVLILLLPIIIAPYFVNQSRDPNDKIVRAWTPYYISILVSFVFSALQGVQDKLDDPFDGMSEDDINLEQIDEWTFSSLQATVNRTFKVGRFQVNNVGCQDGLPKRRATSALRVYNTTNTRENFAELRKVSFANFASRQVSKASLNDNAVHLFTDVLERIPGDTRIEKGGVLRPADLPPLPSSELNNLDLSNKPSEPKAIPLSNAHGIPTFEKKKRVTLGRLFEHPSENETDAVDLKQRNVLFNDNPLVLTEQQSHSENLLDDPNTPLLPNSLTSRKPKLQLKHKQRSSISSSQSLSASPHHTDIRSFSESPSSYLPKDFYEARVSKAYPTIVDLPESPDDNQKTNGTEKICLLPLSGNRDFFYIEKPLQEKNFEDKENESNAV